MNFRFSNIYCNITAPSGIKKHIRNFSSIGKSNILDSFVRADSFKSVIELSLFKILKSELLYNLFIKTVFSVFKPLTTKAQFNTTAVKIIIMLPLLLVTFSTQFLESLRSHSKSITLPAYNWRLIERHCRRVVRPVSGTSPGLDGSVVITDLVENGFGERLLALYDPEFLYKITLGTPLNNIVIHKVLLSDDSSDDESFEEQKFIVSKSFEDTLTYELSFFNSEIYGLRFFEALNTFYCTLNSSFYADGQILLLQQFVDHSETTLYGVHKLRNCYNRNHYFIQSNYKESFSSAESQNSLLCFLYLLTPRYTTVLNGNSVIVGNYQKYSGDLILDLDMLDYQQMFRSLFSLTVHVFDETKNLHEDPTAVNDNDAKSELYTGFPAFKKKKSLAKANDKRNLGVTPSAKDRLSQQTPADPSTKTGVRRYSKFFSDDHSPVIFNNSFRRKSPLLCFTYVWPVTFNDLW